MAGKSMVGRGGAVGHSAFTPAHDRRKNEVFKRLLDLETQLAANIASAAPTQRRRTTHPEAAHPEVARLLQLEHLADTLEAAVAATAAP